ncbi:MAG TPA: hypothetical protein VKG26_10800 [Bacteroidia bacterium]|nr:hypothetical protein [Bacteroidia bacterium]
MKTDSNQFLPNMKEKHIFIIESEAIVRLDFRLQLENMGYNIHWPIPFTNVKETLSKLKPDLIIIDFDLCRRGAFLPIREIMSQHQIPIIYLGVNKVEDVNMNSDLNIIGVFSIPYMTVEIVSLVKKCLAA